MITNFKCLINNDLLIFFITTVAFPVTYNIYLYIIVNETIMMNIFLKFYLKTYLKFLISGIMFMFKISSVASAATSTVVDGIIFIL